MGRTNEYLLPSRPRMQRGEVVVSFLSRLAWANGFNSADEFARITGLPTSAITKPSQAHAEQLAAWSGVSIEELLNFSMPSGTVIRFGAGEVKRTQLQTNGVRYCPACIKNDISMSVPYIRGAWHWRMISHCPHHGCRLELDKGGLTHSSNFRELAHEGSDILDPDNLHAERYFFGRLNQSAGTTYLDQFPPYVAAEFCTLVGHYANALATGIKEYRIPDGYENSRLRRLGYKVASKGREAIWNLLTEYVNDAGKRFAIPRDMYSTAYNWWTVNRYDPAYQPLFRMLQDHAEQSIPLSPGDTFIWTVSRRQIFNVATASREYGISEARVERVLKHAIKVDEVPRFFKRDEVHAVLLEAASYRPTSEAAAAFGCSMKICDDLIKFDLVDVARNREYEGRVYRLVHQNEISSFLRKLDSIVDRKIPRDELAPMLTAFRLARVSVAKILELAFAKRIVRISCSGDKADIGNLLIDPEEVRAVFRDVQQRVRPDRDFGSEMIDLKAARRRLQVNKTTIEDLVDKGIIPFEGLRADPSAILVRTADLDAFEEENISAFQLATDRKTTPQEIVCSLVSLGVQSLMKARFKADYFYSKSDIAALEYQ